jgi:hypothetical protein
MSYHRRATSTKGLSLFRRADQYTVSHSIAEALTTKGMREPFSRDDTTEILGLLLTVSRHHPSSHTLQCSASHSLFSCSFDYPPNFPPQPYGVKGGAARCLLLELLGVRSPSPRDVDVIRKGSHPLTTDDKIAKQYMPDDYRFGCKVELFTDLDRYLSSRDLTINEVIYLNGTLKFSPFALLDSITRTIRPSRYRTGTLSRAPQLSGRVFLKMIRLRAEFLCHNENWQVVGIPDDVEFTESDLAIQIEKALQRGPDVAESFLEHLVEAEFLELGDPPLLPKMIEEINHLTIGDSALIRSLPGGQLHHKKDYN